MSSNKVIVTTVCNKAPNECPDRSDHRLCPGSACKNNSEYFRCRDDKFCIYDHLLCDGYKQCNDGSDEASCTVCPRLNSSLGKSKSFPCFHRYTKLPICAIPCDGRDDLCDDYVDEDCERMSFLLIMLLVGTATVLTSVMVHWTELYFAALHAWN
jgi:hypothetical protein